MQQNGEALVSWELVGIFELNRYGPKVRIVGLWARNRVYLLQI